MRNAAVMAIGVLLLLIQGNLFRVLGLLGLQGVSPDLVLPVILFLAVNEHSMARGALLSFGLGYCTDLFASAPIGLFTFCSVALWWLSRVAAVWISAQTVATQILMAFLFSCVQSAIILMLLTIFGQDPQRPLELAGTVLPHAIGTGLLAPPVFALAARLHQTLGATRRSSEGLSQ